MPLRGMKALVVVVAAALLDLLLDLAAPVAFFAFDLSLDLDFFLTFGGLDGLHGRSFAVALGAIFECGWEAFLIFGFRRGEALKSDNLKSVTQLPEV